MTYSNLLKKSVASSLFCLAWLTGLIGCQPRTPPPSPSEEQLRNVTHTVRAQGETLYAIAAWYTGQGQNWKLLVDANPGLNPNRMRIGETIHIPRSLVVRVEPMPAASVTSNSNSKTKNTRASRNQDRSQDAGSASSGSSSNADSKEDSSIDDPSSAEDLLNDGASSAANEKNVSSAASSLESRLSGSSSSASSVIRSVDDVIDPLATAAPVITAPKITVPAVEKRTKSRDELLQELLKDY